MRKAIGLTVASFVVGCGSGDMLIPELAGLVTPEGGIEITEGVTASLQLDRDTVQVGDTLVVTLEVRNQRRETIELVTLHTPAAFVSTSLDGTPIGLVGGENPMLGMITTWTIRPNDAYRQVWKLTAELGHPRGAPPPIGTYDLVVELQVVEVAGDSIGKVEFHGSFLVAE